MSPQNCQKLKNLLGNIEIFLARNPIFLAQNQIFLNGFPTFVNGFLLSSTAFCVPQWLSTFQKIRENLSTAASIQKFATQALYFLPLALRAL
jgi:hypothetical protein